MGGVKGRALGSREPRKPRGTHNPPLPTPLSAPQVG